MENIIRMFISNSLFLNEVENIELKQAGFLFLILFVFFRMEK